uniref:Uncharacterized protein n=1 Tax=Anguilla anguilla TaxID=7936 RepID=A0A0E9ST00_ANGAN
MQVGVGDWLLWSSGHGLQVGSCWQNFTKKEYSRKMMLFQKKRELAKNDVYNQKRTLAQISVRFEVEVFI